MTVGGMAGTMACFESSEAALVISSVSSSLVNNMTSVPTVEINLNANGPASLIDATPDVRITVAVNRSPGGRDRRQGDTVRHGAGADRQHPGLRFEQIGKRAVEAAGQGIVSVCPGRTGIGFLQGFENCGSNRRLVVASEIKFHREII